MKVERIALLRSEDKVQEGFVLAVFHFLPYLRSLRLEIGVIDRFNKQRSRRSGSNDASASRSSLNGLLESLRNF